MTDQTVGQVVVIDPKIDWPKTEQLIVADLEKQITEQPAEKPVTSEVHQNFDDTLDDVHKLLSVRLDELQNIIDQTRLMIQNHTIEIKSRVSRHLEAAEASLKLSATIKYELENIKKSLNG